MAWVLPWLPPPSLALSLHRSFRPPGEPDIPPLHASNLAVEQGWRLGEGVQEGRGGVHIRLGMDKAVIVERYNCDFQVVNNYQELTQDKNQRLLKHFSNWNNF